MATDQQLVLETAAYWHQKLSKDLMQVESVTHSVLEQCKEIEEKRRRFELMESSIAEKKKRLELMESSLEEKLDDLRVREELMESSIAEKLNELQAREEEFCLFQIFAIREWQEEMDSIKKMSEELKSAKGRHVRQQELLEDWGNQLELISRNINEEFERKHNQLKLKEDIFEQEEKDFEARKKQFGREKDQLRKSKKEGRLEQELQDLEARKQQFERRVRGCNSTKKKIEDWCEELDSRERELRERATALDVKKKKLVKQSKELELKEKNFEERLEELERKEKQYERRHKNLELKEKNLRSGNQQSPKASAKRPHPTAPKATHITTAGKRLHQGNSSGDATKSYGLRQRKKRPRYCN